MLSHPEQIVSVGMVITWAISISTVQGHELTLPLFYLLSNLQIANCVFSHLLKSKYILLSLHIRYGVFYLMDYPCNIW